MTASWHARKWRNSGDHPTPWAAYRDGFRLGDALRGGDTFREFPSHREAYGFARVMADMERLR